MTTHSEWLEKIIAKYSGGLAPDDCARLDDHVLECMECAQAMRDYQELAECLLPIRDSQSLLRLPPRVLELKGQIQADRRLFKEVDSIIDCSLRASELYPVEEGLLETAEAAACLEDWCASGVHLGQIVETPRVLSEPGGAFLGSRVGVGTVALALASVSACAAFAIGVIGFDLGALESVVCAVLTLGVLSFWLPGLSPVQSGVRQTKGRADMLEEGTDLGKRHPVLGAMALASRHSVSRERSGEVGGK